MKKLLCYFVCLFLIDTICVESETIITPYVAPQYFYNVNGTPMIRAYTPIKFEIQMNNNDGFSRQNVSIPLTFYIVGSDYSIYPVDVGGYSSNGSVELLNGFEPGGFWDLGSGLTEFSWDGALPDSICYTGSASAGNGWSSGLGLQIYITFNFEFQLPWNNEIYFCIDSSGFGEGFEWLFEEPPPLFGGPYCYPVRDWIVQPPYITNCPVTEMQAIHSAPFDYYFQATDSEGDMPYTFALLEGPGTIDQNSGFWRYNPDVSEAGDSYNVTVGVSGASSPNEYTECPFMVSIASASGDANTDRNVNLLDVVYIINYLYKSGPAPWHFYHADTDSDGHINILDATQIIDYLYKGGELNCSNVKDDIPLRIGSYCKYERYRQAEDVTDTVTVSVIKYGVVKYQYPDSTEYKQFTINNKWVKIMGEDDPNALYYNMPLSVGQIWGAVLGGHTHYDTVATVQAIDDLPVGHIENAYQILRSTKLEGTETIGIYRVEWFAPGVGMAKLYIWNDEPTITPDETWDLIEYNAI